VATEEPFLVFRWRDLLLIGGLGALEAELTWFEGQARDRGLALATSFQAQGSRSGFALRVRAQGSRSGFALRVRAQGSR